RSAAAGGATGASLPRWCSPASLRRQSGRLSDRESGGANWRRFTHGLGPMTQCAPPEWAPVGTWGLWTFGWAVAKSTAGEGPGTVQEPTGGDRGGSPFSFALPLLIAGIPLAIILLIVVTQVAGGAVWLPVIGR